MRPYIHGRGRPGHIGRDEIPVEGIYPVAFFIGKEGAGSTVGRAPTCLNFSCPLRGERVPRLAGAGEGLVNKPRGRPIPRVPVVVETARWAVLVRRDAPPERLYSGSEVAP